MRRLRAGPVTAEWDGSDLRNVRAGGAVLAQRIYFALRDEPWKAIPGELSDVRVEQRDDAFRVTLESRHRYAEIDYPRRGTIEGAPDGTISYEMDGAANGTFRSGPLDVALDGRALRLDPYEMRQT